MNFKHKYDIIQVHNLPDFLVFSAFIPKMMGVPIILDLHDLMPEFFAGRFKSRMSILAKLVRWQELKSCNFADHVITVSEHWRQALIKRGVPEHKCSVILNVADDQIFFPKSNGNGHKHGPDQFRLIYHGSIHERYGLDLVVLAVDQLRNEIPNIHFTLIGHGDFLPHVAKIVADRGLSSYVSMENLHLAEELPDIIRSCDLGVVPYMDDVFTDGLLPTKLMEYAALEMPAIASRTTAIKAYFSDTNTEFFEPGNVDDLVQKIRYLHNDRERLAELSQGSQKFNQRYNWSKVGTEYVELVRRLQKK